MKQFLIKYRFEHGTPEAWHRQIAEFISELDGDSELNGRITYRCMRQSAGTDYYHLATAADDAAANVLQQREFFRRYTEATKRVAAGGLVEVVPLDVVAETGGAPGPDRGKVGP